MKARLISIALLLAVLSDTFSQSVTEINKIDQQGRKQGAWIKKDQSGNTIYEGTFRDNHPVGEFKRFYADKTLLSSVVYSPDGRIADASMFYPNSYPAAAGRYIDMKKEGKWKFFSSSIKGYLINEETYKNDKRNGPSVRYYPDSTIAEKSNYLNDKREGELLQYFENGKQYLRTYYSGDMLNGRFEVWRDNGKPYFTGSYKNNRRDGKWMIYKKDGSLKYELSYTDGVTLNRQPDIDDSDFFDGLEKNKGKIPDPEKTGNIR